MDEIEMLKMENSSSDQEHRDKFNKMVIEKDETMQAWQKDRDMHELELNENVKQLHAALKVRLVDILSLIFRFRKFPMLYLTCTGASVLCCWDFGAIEAGRHAAECGWRSNQRSEAVTNKALRNKENAQC